MLDDIGTDGTYVMATMEGTYVMAMEGTYVLAMEEGLGRLELDRRLMEDRSCGSEKSGEVFSAEC